MTAPICQECQEIINKERNILRGIIPPAHYPCVAGWVNNDQSRLQEVFDDLIFSHYVGDDKVYHRTQALLPLLKVTGDQVGKMLDNLRISKDEVDYDLQVNLGGVRALIDVGLLTFETFISEYQTLIDTTELYEMMVKGYLLPPRLIIKFCDAVNRTMRGEGELEDDDILFYVKVLQIHHRAVRDRKERHWLTLKSAVFLSKLISDYHRRKFAPGSQEMQIAQTRFETGDYPV